MKKRLVYFSAFLSPYRSGAEAMVEEVSKRLKDSYDITIVTGRYSRTLPRHDTLHGVSIIRVGIGHTIDKWLFPFLAPLEARKLTPDIVHAVLETFAGLALFFCRSRAKKILTLQTTNRSFLKRMIVRHPDTVTAISSALTKNAASYGRNDAVLIPNGIDLFAIRNACERYTKVPGRLLFVGRLEKMKGVDTLLRALTLCHTGQLHIVGDGSERQRLQALAQELGTAERVVFRGRLTDDALFLEYAEAEIFSGLSRSEALGNVFLEAEAAGCAVVATNVGGIPDIVKDGVTGILVPPDDAAAAARALQTLSLNPTLRQTYADAGKKHAEAYDWGMISDQYKEILT